MAVNFSEYKQNIPKVRPGALKKHIPRHPIRSSGSANNDQNVKTLKWSAWLGWQMESNWADPFLFLVYSIVKPIAGSLILVVMYTIISSLGGQTDIGLFHFMYVSNAFFMFVAQVLFGVTWIIHDDREHFQTMRYIYIAPSNYFMYMIGRSLSKLVITGIAVAITLAFGTLFLDVPLDILSVNWPFFAIIMVIGIACIMSFGLALAGVSFLTAKHSGGMNEGIAGLFYLFCGVVFPIGVLPAWGVTFAKILPVTYWLELLRRVLHLGADIDPALSDIDTTSAMIILIVSTIAFSIFAIAIFKIGDYIARKNGLIDATSAY